jgi:transcriptional regulator with XRE-family HTH domain
MPRLTIVEAHSAAGPHAPAVADIGGRVRRLRSTRGWTLDQTSQRSGLSRAAISKIERGQMSPTFQAMQKLAAGFGISLAELLRAGERPRAQGRRSVILKGEGPWHDTPTYGLRFLTAELKNTAFLVAEIVVRARSLDEYADWDRHDDEDFVYILGGRMTLYTEEFAPVTLGPGDAVYFDARMGHASVSLGDTEATALWVSAPIPSL